jgi:phosphoribosylamine-glycine ligase
MRTRLITKNCDAIALLYRIWKEGNNVDFWVKEAKARPSYEGILPQVKNWSEKLTKDTICLFDMVGMGSIADDLSKKGFPVYGGGKLNDTLELDREFGVKIAKAGGVKIPSYERFKSFDKATAFIKGSKTGWAFKPQDNKSPVKTYVSQTTDEMLEMMEWFKKSWKGKVDFILQGKIDGTEVSTEAWYVNGEFVPNSINSTIELKRLMEGDKGPNTGCMGSVVWFWKKQNPKIYKHTLARIEPFLKRHKYNGPLDMNCIVSDKDGLPYFLEFTSRFGYNALYAAIPELEPIDEFLAKCARGELPTIRPSYKWTGAVRVSIPPYPYDVDAKQTAGRPLDLKPDENIWLLDVKYDGKKLVTAGVDGVICEVTGIADNLAELGKGIYKRIGNLKIGDKQYRTDLIEVANQRLNQLRKANYF